LIYLLDTNACVSYLKSSSRSPIAAKLATLDQTDVVLCSVVKAELHYGAEHSSDPPTNRQRVAQFFSLFRSLPFDDAAAEEYGRIRAALAAQGTPIGPNDLMIAAIAVTNSLTLVTRNTKEFKRVSGLRLEDWEGL
jgi:tRNA(fMet)-specific endonuclease VapC